MLERGNFNPLDVSGVVDQLEFGLVNMVGVVVAEEEFLGFDSELILGNLGGGEGLGVGHGLTEVPGVFAEIDFTIHAFGYFLVIDLLLDVEFGQFGRAEPVGRLFGLVKHAII